MKENVVYFYPFKEDKKTDILIRKIRDKRLTEERIEDRLDTVSKIRT